MPRIHAFFFPFLEYCWCFTAVRLFQEDTLMISSWMFSFKMFRLLSSFLFLLPIGCDLAGLVCWQNYLLVVLSLSSLSQLWLGRTTSCLIVIQLPVGCLKWWLLWDSCNFPRLLILLPVCTDYTCWLSNHCCFCGSFPVVWIWWDFLFICMMLSMQWLLLNQL